MDRCLTLLAVLSLSTTLFADDAARTPPPEAGDMKVLFNGKDLTGWDGDPRLWSVKDGVLRGETTKENAAKGNTFIIWKDGTVKDFDLRLSFRMNAANNSGIQYRSKHITEGKVNNAWVVRGYQHELRNEKKFPNTSELHLRRGRQARPDVPGRRKGRLDRRRQEGRQGDVPDPGSLRQADAGWTTGTTWSSSRRARTSSTT